MMDQKVLLGRECISALADGQVRGEEFARALAFLDASEEGRSTWHLYHVIGDVLRCPDLAASREDAAFVGRLRVRMALLDGVDRVGETRLHPGISSAGDVIDNAGGHPGRNSAEGANDPDIRWKWLAGFSSLVAATALGWQLAGGVADPGAAATQLTAVPPAGALAVASPAPVTASSTASVTQDVMLRDPRLDELLAAHKQLGGTSALQMPAGFLRNATFESPGR